MASPYTMPTADFATSSLSGVLAAAATSCTVGTGLNWPATNGAFQVSYDTANAIGVTDGPETIYYTAYNSGTGAITGMTRGMAQTTDVQHSSGQSVQVAPSVLYLTGELGYAAVTADQGSITTIVDLTSLTVTVTVPAGGRRIKITGSCLFSCTEVNDMCALFIYESATALKSFSVQLSQTSTNYGALTTVVITPTAGAHTYKLRASRLTGSGTITMAASATDPAFILVELI